MLCSPRCPSPRAVPRLVQPQVQPQVGIYIYIYGTCVAESARCWPSSRGARKAVTGDGSSCSSSDIATAENTDEALVPGTPGVPITAGVSAAPPGDGAAPPGDGAAPPGDMAGQRATRPPGSHCPRATRTGPHPPPVRGLPYALHVAGGGWRTAPHWSITGRFTEPVTTTIVLMCLLAISASNTICMHQ